MLISSKVHSIDLIMDQAEQIILSLASAIFIGHIQSGFVMQLPTATQRVEEAMV